MRRSTLIATLLAVLLVGGMGIAIRAQVNPVAAQSSVIAVSAVDFAFSPSTITATQGQTIRLTNNGNSPHNVVIEGVTDSAQMALVFAGSSGDLVVPANLAPGNYVFYCGVAGHRQFGMVGSLTVVLANASASASASSSSRPSVSVRPSGSAQPSGSASPSVSASGSPSSRPSASARSTRPPRPTSTVRPSATATPVFTATATVRPSPSTRPPRPTATIVQPTATTTPPATVRPTRPPRTTATPVTPTVSPTPTPTRPPRQ